MTDPRWMVVTGASSGIGAEMARLAAARGRALVLVARREDRLRALAAELGARVRVETIVLDLEQPSSAEALMAALADRGIEPETLVNNAGFGLRGGFATMPYEEQMAMVELNVTTLTRLCRLALPGMVARRRGGIVNVASMAAYQAIPFMAVYAATKAYVVSLSEALHEEMRGQGVVVTVVCPGPTKTEFTMRANLEKSKLFSTGAMSAVEVARLGLDGHDKGRAVVVTGGRNIAIGIGSKLLPRLVSRRLAGWMQG
jgi:short-subunit dehydrogenase